MKVVQVGALATTIASLSASAYGYTFADTAKEEETTTVESTGLTTNEESRIYGGSEANIDKYPFLASLRDTLFEMNMCGGTLIAPQYILTAGHCIKTDEMDMIATFGTNESDGSGLTVPIIEGFRHPMYKKKEHLYDVGLLKLKKPVKRKMAKLCAADGSDNKVGTMGTVLGWGKTETSGELGSPILRQLTVPVISNAECAKFKKYVGRVTDGMLCAGTGNGKDTCNGDSGGPLIVDDDIIIGCVSWGSKCGEQAGIYTRLTYVMDYIEDILAGGDGSKFNVTTSSSGSTEEDVSLPSSAEGSANEESSESGSVEDTADQTTKKSKGTKTPAVEEDSESGSDDLSWLVETVSGSGSDAGLVKVPDWLLKYFGGSASGSDLSWLFASNSDSGSGSTTGSESTSEESGSDDAVLMKGKTAKATKAPVVEDSESGSDDLSWLLASDSDSDIGSESNSASESGSEDAVLVKDKTKATKTTKAPAVADSESGSDDLSWLFASDSDSDIGSESGSEDAVLVKGKTKTKATKATKAPEEDSPFQQTSEDSPFQQTSVEDESTSASTSASTSGSESDESDLVHQSEQSEPTTTKQK